MRTGLRGVKDFSARITLGCAVVTDRGLRPLPRAQWATEATRGAPRQVDQGGGIRGNLKTGEVVGEFGRRRGEGLGRKIPREFTAGELLAHGIAVVAFVFDGDAQRSGRTTQRVPGSIDGTANRERPGVVCPENGGFVAGIEGADPAVGAEQAGHFVDGRKAQVTVAWPTEGLVLVQDRAVDQVRTGIRGEEDFAAGELLTVAVADLVNLAVLAAQHGVRTARRTPCCADGVGGVTLRRGQRQRRDQHCGRGSHGHPQCQAPGGPG